MKGLANQVVEKQKHLEIDQEVQWNRFLLKLPKKLSNYQTLFLSLNCYDRESGSPPSPHFMEPSREFLIEFFSSAICNSFSNFKLNNVVLIMQIPSSYHDLMDSIAKHI